MILSDYYKYERLANQRSKSRMDCTISTKTYPDFDEKSFIYIGATDHIKANRHRKTDLSITSGKGKHVTSVFPTDLENGLAYGDNKGTTDLLLFVSQNFSIAADGCIADGATIEVFVARGKKHERNVINNLFLDGQLDIEIEQLRQKSTKSTAEKKE
jgi:hypothetical protein